MDHLFSGLRIFIHFSGDRIILFTKSRERERERERDPSLCLIGDYKLTLLTYSLLNSLFLSVRKVTSLSASSWALWYSKMFTSAQCREMKLR